MIFLADRPAHGKGRMGATLDTLHRLQFIEDKLRSLREQIKSKQRSVRARQNRVAKIERDAADLHQAIRQAQAQSDKLELDRKAREEHITSLREALNRTKSNKDYAAILTQLNTEKADIMKLEDETLKALSQVDEHRKTESELQAKLAVEQEQVAKLARIAQETEAKMAAKLEALEAQRTAATDQIPPAVLNVFERACERHEGEAMAQLEQVHPKRAEYVCSGCNMSIPLEVINAIQSRDDIQQCETCSRILYIDAPQGALA